MAAQAVFRFLAGEAVARHQAGKLRLAGKRRAPDRVAQPVQLSFVEQRHVQHADFRAALLRAEDFPFNHLPQERLHQVIQRMTDICRRHNLNYEVEEIFAAQNKNRTQPGVVILPQVEQTYGEKAVEAHVLRRIFTTIRILNGDTDELTTTLVVAYHQDGIQAAIGPCVRICHNQCILSPERSVANYGKDKVTTEELFGKVDDWMRNFERDMDADRSRIQRLKEKVLTPGELYMIIGMLTALRVSHDSADKRLASQVDTYPLNQGQISVFTEELLKLSLEQPRITAWDVYNVATEIYKPGKTDFPAMIPQNGAMADFLLSYNQN